MQATFSGPYIMHRVDKYPLLIANTAMFKNINQSEWNNQLGEVWSPPIYTNVNIKTNLKQAASL